MHALVFDSYGGPMTVRDVPVVAQVRELTGGGGTCRWTRWAATRPA